MNQDSWINRNVARLMPKSSKPKEAVAPVDYAQTAPKNVANGAAGAAGAEQAGNKAADDNVVDAEVKEVKEDAKKA